MDYNERPHSSTVTHSVCRNYKQLTHIINDRLILRCGPSFSTQLSHQTMEADALSCKDGPPWTQPVRPAWLNRHLWNLVASTLNTHCCAPEWFLNQFLVCGRVHWLSWMTWGCTAPLGSKSRPSFPFLEEKIFRLNSHWFRCHDENMHR